MPTESKTFTLPNGRIVAWCEYGSPSSPQPPIFFLHGSPSSRFEAAVYHQQAQTLNLKIISPDRPSSGLSSPCPERTFLTYPSDLLALASHLNIPKFHLLGSSGGCPYLLACLKEIPREKLIRAQVVSGMWPTKLGMEGSTSYIDFCSTSKSKELTYSFVVRFIQKAVLWLSYYSPSTAGTLMDYSFGSCARDPDPTKLTNMLASHSKSMPARDQGASSNPKFMNKIELACREAFRQNGEAAASEFGLWARDWGFELRDVDASKVTVWHGREDGNVGVGQAEGDFWRGRGIMFVLFMGWRF